MTGPGLDGWPSAGLAGSGLVWLALVRLAAWLAGWQALVCLVAWLVLVWLALV